MIERYLLRYFLAVVDQGNFSRAAGACNVSQPTLSAGIAKLEQAVETQLFIRSNQRVQLTEAGARFLVHARRIEREFNEALQAMGGSSPRTVLRMGVLGSVPGALLSAAFAASKCDPDTVEFVFGTEREIDPRAAHRPPPRKPDPYTALGLFVFLCQPQHALAPEAPMGVAEPEHRPPPCRVAGKR